MTVTVVLRLVRECLEAGQIVGQVERVATGERATVHSGDELVAFALAAADEPTGEEHAR